MRSARTAWTLSGTLLAAIEQVFPLATAREVFAQGKPGAIEKKDLKVGFIPITCATPIIESRVTSSASCSSVMCSDPSGRCGNTI